MSMALQSLSSTSQHASQGNTIAPCYELEDSWSLDGILQVAEATFERTLSNTVNTTLAMEKAHNSHISKALYEHPHIFNLAIDVRRELVARAFSSKESRASYLSFTSRSMAYAIYGSNMQEKAGLDLDYTIRACDVVFSVATGDAAAIQKLIDETYEDDEGPRQAYKDAIATLRNRNPDHESQGMNNVRRARKEVIQHAQAMLYIVQAILSEEKLSEDLIKETHRIFCHGISKEGDPVDAPTTYEGVYRETEARAGNTMFTPARHVPREMGIFVFKNDTSGHHDPFYLAADVSQDFITIHSFEDGNGRLGRLLMNAFLMKYARIVVVIGDTKEDQREYLAIMEEAGDGETEEAAKSKLAEFILMKAVTVLLDLKRKF